MNTSSYRQRLFLPAASAVTFFGFLDTHLLIPVIALYATGLGAGIGIVGLIVGLYSIVNTPANIFFGRIIDKKGFKIPLLIGLCGAIASMALYVVVVNPFQLALLRVFHGTAGAMIAPATMAAVANNSLQDRKARSMSFYGIAIACASLVGYPVSAVVSSRLGFNFLFLSGAAVMIIGIVFALILPATKNPLPVAKSPTGSSFFHFWSLFTKRELVPSYTAVFAQYFTFGGIVTLLPVHLNGLGMGTFEVGMLLTAFSVMFVITQLPGGAISDRLGRTRPIIVGLSCITVSLALLPVFSLFWQMALVMAIYGIGYGALFPSISALISDHTGTGERGLATGIFHALLTAGVAIGAPVIGWLGGLYGTQTGLFMTPVPMAMVLLLTLLISKRR